MYGHLRLPQGGDRRTGEAAFGARHEVELADSLSVAVTSERTVKLNEASEPQAATASTVAVAYAPSERFGLLVTREWKESGNSLQSSWRAVLSGRDARYDLEYRLAGMWLSGDGAAGARRLTSELDGEAAFGDRLDGNGALAARYIDRTYSVPATNGFSAETERVRVFSVDYARLILTSSESRPAHGFSVQAVLKQKAYAWEEVDGTHAAYSVPIALGQVGLEMNVLPKTNVEIYGRVIADALGNVSRGAAIELVQKLSDDIAVSVGYGTIGIDDPDLRPLIVWPEGWFAGLRLKF